MIGMSQPGLRNGVREVERSPPVAAVAVLAAVGMAAGIARIWRTD